MKVKLLLIVVFCSSFAFSQLLFPSQANSPQERKIGLKNSHGTWILPPVYNEVGDFYDRYAKLIDSVAIIAKNVYYKKSNIVLKTNHGLINREGKFLIPLQYKSLICKDGFCIAKDDNNEVLIVDYQNNILQKLEGNGLQIAKKVILFNRGNDHYFRRIGDENEYGPFSQVSFTNASKIFAVKVNGEKAFYNGDGSVYLRDDRMVDYVWQIFIHDIHIVKTENGMTFANKEGVLYEKFYGSIDGNLEYCNNFRMISDYGQCGERGVINFDEILKYFGFETIGNAPVVDYLLRDEVEEKKEKYDIVREFTSNYSTSLKKNLTAVLVKNLSPKNRFENYSMYNVHTNVRVLNSEFPFTLYDYYSGISSDEKSGKKYFVTPERHMEIVNSQIKYFEERVKLPIYSNILVFNETDSDPNSSYSIIDEAGKIIETDFVEMTNFYKGFAIAISKDGKTFLVNENLEILKPIAHSLNYLSAFDQNGMMIDRNSIIDYKGNVILEISGDEYLSRKTDFFYQKTVMYLEGGNHRYYNKYYDRTGKLLSEKDEPSNQDTYFFADQNFDYFSIYSEYFYYHYDYNGNFLGSSKDGLELEIPPRIN